MANIVPLEAIPNQSLSVQIDNFRYDIRLKDLGQVMSADVSLNDEEILTGQRVVAGTQLIPYPYLRGDGGNFFFITEDEEIPYWESFNINQELVYLTPDEIEELSGD